MATKREMPFCRFCGVQCEEGRDPQEGWFCRSCGKWQDHRLCYACGATTWDQNVANWQSRRTQSHEYAAWWAAGTAPAGPADRASSEEP